VSGLVLELLRHGETEAGPCFLGRTDAALSEHGWQQMSTALAGRSPLDYERIYSSPLQRCATFARHWAGAERLQLDERLSEYDFGDWDGMTAATLHARDPEALARFWSDPWRHPPPRGERLADFFARLESLIERLQRQHRQAVLLICHGGVIRALHTLLNALPPAAMFSYPVEHASLHRLRDRRR
jgi:alpha-ribazole phosphatase